MIDLYKANGQLKARAKLEYDYKEAVIAKAKEEWLEAQKMAYDTQFKTVEILDDSDSVIGFDYQENCPTFEDWLNETVVVSEAVEATETTPYIPAVIELVREFVAPEVTQVQVADYLKSRYADLRRAEYPDYAVFTDAWVKGDEAGMEAYRQACLAVKAKYSK